MTATVPNVRMVRAWLCLFMTVVSVAALVVTGIWLFALSALMFFGLAAWEMLDP